MLSVRLFAARLRLIRTDRFPECDGEPVPAVDCDDGHGQLDQLLLGELRPRRRELFVRRVTLGDERDGLGPLERRPLASRVERRFPPGVQGVEALLALAEGARVLRVHVYAEGAAVDLR